MPFVLTNEKLKEFLEFGTDVAVHVLSLVKDAPEEGADHSGQCQCE